MRQGAIRWLYFVVVRRAPARAAAAALQHLFGDADIRVRDRVITLPDLPEAADGLRILHVSDLHLNRRGPGVREVAAAARQVGPVDLIVHTGDFINENEDIDLVAELLPMMPECKHGTIAVLGNHDYYSLAFQTQRNDTDRLIAVLEKHDVRVLKNESTALDGLGLHVVGLDDPVTHMSDLEAAYAGVPKDAPVLMLAHTPDIVLDLGGRRPLVVLAGHTHGGQVSLPGIGAVVRTSGLPRHMQQGEQHVDGVPLHISPGVGFSGPRVRIGVPSELTRITLRRV